jgi:hypothetical protein
MQNPPPMPLEQQLVRLTSSLIECGADYALARLELGTRLPALDLPPPLPPLSDASETSLRAGWDELESRLDAIRRSVKRIDADRRTTDRQDPAFLWVRRVYRELDQYTRALRWVLTVTERIADESE